MVRIICSVMPVLSVESLPRNGCAGAELTFLLIYISRTSEYFVPTLEYIKYRGRDLAQVRGMWDVQDDFMGGPFVSHSFYSPDGKEIIVAEAWVYAPQEDKRNFLRQVEALLYSWEWKKEEPAEENAAN